MSIISTNAVELTQSSQAATESADGRRQAYGNPLARLGSLFLQSAGYSSFERAHLCRNPLHSENETVNHDESRTLRQTQKVSASRLQAQFIAWETRAAHAH